MIIRVFIIFIFIVFVSYPEAWGGNFGFGVHSGYGVIKFEEKETFRGVNFESESKQNVILFGGSGEYSFPPRRKNFYVGITTDWAFGLKDRETWKQDNVQVQINDMRVFGQFYDLRFGYKNSLDNLYPVRKKAPSFGRGKKIHSKDGPELSNGVYYRLYVSGGWDGLHFKRDKFIRRGISVTDSITEDISLWRTGVGLGLGYKLNKWALDGRLAYSYYPKGKTKDSSLPQFTFDTNGTCLDVGLGVAREIAKNMSFYLGGSYTLQRLKGNTTSNNTIQAIFWKSKLEILVGMVNLTYAF